MSETRLRAAVVGCGGMGTSHAGTMASLGEYELVGACDVQKELAERAAAKAEGAKAYTDYATMLRELKPDVVAVATNNVTHAPLTIEAVKAGVRGVYCEKPMSADYGSAKMMVDACRAAGAKLAVNHQRRCLPVFRKMRELIAAGAIGDVHLVVCSNAGDILSDGTHFIDTVRHLAGDADVKWVLGQVYRKPAKADEPHSSGFKVSGDYRYGHVVETGALGVFEFANGIRAEVHSGEMMMHGKWYQYYEVLGSKGRLIRNMDNANPPLIIQDEAGMRPVEFSAEELGENTMQIIFRQFAQMILTGAGHPLSGESALKDQELVMAIYESARLRERLMLPLAEERFPLELMIESGQLPDVAEKAAVPAGELDAAQASA